MALKSTLDIDIDDSKFQRFKDLFDRYTEALKKQPEIWQKIGGIHQKHAEHFAAIGAAMANMQQMQKRRTEDSEREVSRLSFIDRLWTNISRSSGVTAHNVANSTRDFLKWTGLLSAAGGLLGLGGLWGIDRMASGLSGERRQAMGLGLAGVGQLRAFHTNFDPLIGDTSGILGWVAEMQQNISKQAPAFALLHHGLRGRPGEQLEMLDALRNFARQNKDNLPFLGEKFASWGLNIPADQQRIMATVGDTEWNRTRGAFLRDQNTLGPNDRVAQQWVEFTKQMERSKETMKTAFEVGLVKLAPQLEKLSVAATNLVTTLLGSQAAKDAINALSKGVNELATYLGSKEFRSDVKSFMDGVESLAQGMRGFTADPLGTVGGWIKGQFRTPSQAWQEIKNTFGSLDWWGLRGLAPNKAYAASHFGDYLSRLDQHFNIGQGTLEMVRALEASGNDAVSKRGARGQFQLMPANYAGIDPRDPVESANRAAQLIQQLMAAFQGNRSQVLAAYNAGQGTVEAAMAAGGPMWRAYLPPETQAYLKRAEVNLNITNNTGGSTIAAAAQSVAGAP